jgi:phage shock protein C
MNVNKRLYRSNEPVFAGVCGGIAEYFELDPTFIRILAVIFTLAGFGLPIIAYLMAMIVIPKRSNDYPNYIDVKPAPVPTSAAAAASTTAAAASPATPGTAGATNAGADHRNAGPSVTAAVGQAVAGAAVGVDVGLGSVGYAAEAPSSATATHTAQSTPHTSAPGSATHYAWKSTEATAAPGRAYTACNPQAYDAVDPSGKAAAPKRPWYSIRTNVMLGILLVGVGLLALLGTLLNISILSFWPMIIIVMGFMMLCTPGARGWSLVRAGHAILMIAIGFSLQLWMLNVVTGNAFVLTFLNLWPVLLVVLGLSIIGAALRQSVFNLFASLLLAAALLFGIWGFGQISEPLYIDGPGNFDFQISVPSPSLDIFTSPNGTWLLR